VLQGMQPEVGDIRRFIVSVDSENSAH